MTATIPMAQRPIVIKVGGEVVSSPQLAQVAQGIQRLVRGGAKVAVVHGGGPQVSALQERLGIPVRKLAGRRFTDKDTLSILKAAVAGQVNVDLCAGLRAWGLAPVGLHGAVFAKKRPPRAYEEGGELIDLGEVGDVTDIDVPLLSALWQAGRIPVLACLGVGEGQALYNINADTVASALSSRLPAQMLMLVSDLPVLRDIQDRGSRIPLLTRAMVAEGIKDGTFQGGMVAKLEEALSALKKGVPEVVITTDLDENSTRLRENDGPAH